jgi:hypothetical protein
MVLDDTKRRPPETFTNRLGQSTHRCEHLHTSRIGQSVAWREGVESACLLGGLPYEPKTGREAALLTARKNCPSQRTPPPPCATCYGEGAGR